MNGQITIPEYFQLAADKGGFIRESYIEAELPTSLSNVTVMPFFGDVRSQFVLSSLILPRYLAAVKTGRYFVLCSHPGLAGLFPYVDEYWSVGDMNVANELKEKAAGFTTTSDKALLFRQALREYFRDLATWESDLAVFYEGGLTARFFEHYREVMVALPPLRSLRMDLSRQINSRGGYKVFVHPTIFASTWHHEHKRSRIDRRFWRELYDRLLENGILPIVWQNAGCHDLSPEYAGKCLFFNDENILDVLAVMRACHITLDVHSGISRYAAVARSPYLCVQERHQYGELKEYELDDLCVVNKVYKYIFSFVTILESQRWGSLLDNIVNKLNNVLPVLNRDEWPTTSEYAATVPYSMVREKKSRRIGTKFIKVPHM